jgi:hypothetical protein
VSFVRKSYINRLGKEDIQGEAREQWLKLTFSTVDLYNLDDLDFWNLSHFGKENAGK